MKKNVLLLLALSVLTISCGGKNGEKNGEKAEANEEVVIDCACSELYEGKLMGKLFTGTCANKDQNDTIILKKSYKNGFRISEMTKQKVNGKYIITQDETYDDNEVYNGFSITLKEDDEFTYTSFYCDYKDGKQMNLYEVYLDAGDDGSMLRARWGTKEGKFIDWHVDETLPEESRPKCMPDAESISWNADRVGWELEQLEKPVFDKVVSGLQKEFPKFYYVK